MDEKTIPQISELIKLYHPDILWFDTAGKLPPAENLRIMKALREVDKNVVISGRLVHGWGDYDDTTDRPANFPPHEGDWEGIPTTDESYGWNKFDTSHKPPSHFIQLLAKAAARGGNLLLNVGPMGDGNIDPKDVTILQGVGDWWKVNGESIRGTTRTPLPVQTWGESTRKGNKLYLHVFNWPTNGQLVVGGLKSSAGGLISFFLADDFDKNGARRGGAPPRHNVSRINASDVVIDVSTNAPDKTDSVVVLECNGEIQADTNRLLQPEFSSDTLRAFDGELHGRGLKFGPGKKTDDLVLDWTKTNQFITWPVRLAKAATYEVLINYIAPEEAAGSAFTVSFGSQDLHGEVKAGANQIASLGRVSLKPGNFEIKVAATKINGSEVFRLRSLELKAISLEQTGSGTPH